MHLVGIIIKKNDLHNSRTLILTRGKPRRLIRQAFFTSPNLVGSRDTPCFIRMIYGRIFITHFILKR